MKLKKMKLYQNTYIESIEGHVNEVRVVICQYLLSFFSQFCSFSLKKMWHGLLVKYTSNKHFIKLAHMNAHPSLECVCIPRVNTCS